MLEDLGLGGSGGQRAMAAVLFMSAGTNAYDAFSAVNSSPWTSETFGGDPEKEKSLREYVRHAMIISSIYAVGGAVIAGGKLGVATLAGAALASVYMYWLYARAIGRAKAKSSRSKAEGDAAVAAWNGGGSVA